VGEPEPCAQEGIIIPKSIFVTFFLVFIVVINVLGIRGYGEAEFVFAIIKITAIVGFMSVPSYLVPLSACR
jgi:amino acid permease